MVETARMLRNLLLICGILSSLLYVGTDILAGTLWEGYSFTSQAISELSAIGAPTRPLVVPLDLAYDVLMIAFGLGVWGYSRKRALRFTGGLLVGMGAVGLVQVSFFPMHLRGAEATFTDIMHSILAGVHVLLILLAMGFGATAYGKRFRLYSIGTLLTLLVLGAVLGFVGGAQITVQGKIAPPQWFGVSERITVYGSMLWVVVLAIVLLRAEKGPGLVSDRDA
ncbi:MAG: DUF998 domain-containing protein [Candidatus Bathyarchaeota archaeon]|nr:DUF998 domain-containing protein [Candidatus Bathyarchaeota archaeon]MDH5686930.1 DUF998 domain-containing protein [Candidatus Bathyarchaeota archaeon]